MVIDVRPSARHLPTVTITPRSPPNSRFLSGSICCEWRCAVGLRIFTSSACPNDLLTKFVFPPEGAGTLEQTRSNRNRHHESRQSTRKPRPVGLAGFPGPRFRHQGRPAKAERYLRPQGRHVESVDLREGDRQFGRI